MSARTATRIACFLWALSLTCVILSGVFHVLNPAHRPLGDGIPLVLDVGLFVLFMSFATVGALVVSRQPGNLVGWIFCTLGFCTPLAAASEEYALYVLKTEPGSFPGGEVAVWLAAWVGGPSMIVLMALIFLLFPAGRLLSRRWRPVVWLDFLALALVTVWQLEPGPMEDAVLPKVVNPFGIPGAGPLLGALGPIGFFLTLAGAMAGAASLILRLRRARGVERRQLKWFVFAGALFCATFAVAPVLWSLPASPGTDWIWPALFLLGVGSIPVATGIAILKHNLYDIDLIINRTLVYGVLTVTLALVYVGTVVSLQYALRALSGGGSQLAVVASTLVIAGLFNPLRRRIQNIIDRRFYRRKYDAAKTLETFSERLRNETDLEALNADLVSVVRETVQPAHVSLWLRSSGHIKRRAVE